MIAYSLVGTNDLPRAVAFFEALFSEFNAKHVWEGDTGTAWSNGDQNPGVGVIKPFNGNPATIGNGSMVALAASSKEQVDRVHAKALALGGADEGAVGQRGDGFYAGYFRDLDGNKFAVVFFG
ncbi:MAG: VOC family protein [Rhodanobacteraceae bacterium]|nr:VOC family protein [Rhodanobacteraceae bacterium]MBK7044062.1 VOC family protein [Rhodanobacteraceae bacterium]MBP9155445.1 VOC family protein [Xanthomonadales bacterium]HQW80418.1 VOC family protein [Pseudomonadota bacterium]